MGGIGPFESFAFPGVYTQTQNEAPRVSAAGSLRFPAFVGVADEVTTISNFEMARGSSSLADNPIVREDVSSQLTGANRNFTVSEFPIVRGDGNGTVTSNPNDITVYVNGNPVPVSSVNGTTGVVYLVSIPALGDTILVSYYFKLTDTLISSENLSVQADSSNKDFKVKNVPIVQGDNGGIIATDPTKVSVTVNSVAVTVSSLDGETGIITLAVAPASGATVLVTYYTNTFQDTYDILPSPDVASLTRVGLSPGTSDFINGTDFVLDTTGNFYTINWGHSYKVVAGQHTISADYFDSSKITGLLYDNRIYRREADGTANGINKTFTLEITPVTGQGLGYPTDDISKVSAYVGANPFAATDATVVSLDASLKTITLSSAPAPSSKVWVTQYSNLLPDDSWTLVDTTTGVVGVGTYTLSGVNTGTAMDVLWSNADTSVASPSFGSENVTYPAGTGEGNRDTQVIPGYSVAETVKLTFVSSSSYTVGSTNPVGTGSSGDNTGWLNHTYIDSKTGFRVTVMEGSSVVYTSGDYIGYTVSPAFVTSNTPTRAIPGFKATVPNTTGITVGDTGIVNTYNKSGNEPNVGDFYYVTFDEVKSTFNTASLFTLEKDALSFTGPISITNKLALAAHLSFLNGAPAVALLQIQKTVGEDDAGDAAYITGIKYFDQPMVSGDQPSLLQPVTTSQQVLNYLKTSNIIQAGIRYANERMSYFGFPLNTSPTSAQVIAKATNSERMIAIYPDGGITTVTDQLGNDIEYLVDGSLLAAAISGRDTSPAFDVATPLTRKPVVGFKRLYRRLDAVTAAQTANAGITLLEEQAAGIIIKIDLTTDLTSVLTRTPSVIRIKDFVQKGTRSILQPYIGLKLLSQRTSEIAQTVTSYMSSLRRAQIIVDFTGVKATIDPNDATTVNVEATYSPVLPLMWIVVTYNLRNKI